MALVTCKECHKQISNSAKVCPNCGAKPSSHSILKIIAVVFLLFVIISIISRIGEVSTSVSSSTTGSVSSGAPALPHWTYDTSADAMSGKSSHSATIESVNTLQFKFPYQRAQHGSITLRNHPRYGKNVLLEIERGQFLCGVENCSISVRFDDGTAHQFTASEPADHSTTTLFVQPYDRFVAELKKSKKVYVSATFYQEGNPVLEFDTEGLKW